MKRRYLRSVHDTEYIDSLVDGLKSGDSNSVAAFFGATADDEWPLYASAFRDEFEAENAFEEAYVRFISDAAEMSSGRKAAARFARISDGVISEAGSRAGNKEGDVSAPPKKLGSDMKDMMLFVILRRCGLEENTLPLSVIREYDMYRTKKISFTRIFVILIIALVILVPLFYVDPSFTVMRTGTSNRSGYPVYRIVESSVLPVKSVIAEQNGQMVLVTQDSKTIYKIYPVEEGRMTITVKTIGMGSTSRTVIVDPSDSEAPVRISDERRGKELVIYVADSGTGVDFDNVSARDSSGRSLDIRAVDKSENKIVLMYPKSSIVVSVPDKTGNVLQIRYSK
jgi:hypothetical protein